MLRSQNHDHSTSDCQSYPDFSLRSVRDSLYASLIIIPTRYVYVKSGATLDFKKKKPNLLTFIMTTKLFLIWFYDDLQSLRHEWKATGYRSIEIPRFELHLPSLEDSHGVFSGSKVQTYFKVQRSLSCAVSEISNVTQTKLPWII